MPDHVMKANDTRPRFQGQIGYSFSAGATLPTGWVETRAADANGNGRLALPSSTYFGDGTTNATLQFIMRNATASNESDDATYVLDGAVTVPKVSAAAAWTDVATGKLQYTWTGANTNSPGPFLCEIEITHTDLTVETFPRDSYVTVLITTDLDGAG